LDNLDVGTVFSSSMLFQCGGEKYQQGRFKGHPLMETLVWNIKSWSSNFYFFLSFGHHWLFCDYYQYIFDEPRLRKKKQSKRSSSFPQWLRI